jgi:Tol biopolymer transport system component
VSWDGTQDIPLTYEVDHSVSDPGWSPDGKYISFLSDRTGAPDVKGNQVWVLDRRGGEARQLTGVKGKLSGYKWSPDAKKLLLIIAEDPEQEAKGKEKMQVKKGSQTRLSLTATTSNRTSKGTSPLIFGRS